MSEEELISVCAINQADGQALESIISSTGLLPPGLLSEMLDSYFSNDDGGDSGAAKSLWLKLTDFTHSDNPVGVAFANYEVITDNSWTLVLIAIHSSVQGRGLGTHLIREVERVLATTHEARLLTIETSSANHFAATRRFYENQQYTVVAQVPDFYADGEDKIVFLKRLMPSLGSQ